jgi:hypothetical protein
MEAEKMKMKALCLPDIPPFRLINAVGAAQPARESTSKSDGHE